MLKKTNALLALFCSCYFYLLGHQCVAQNEQQLFWTLNGSSPWKGLATGPYYNLSERTNDHIVISFCNDNMVKIDNQPLTTLDKGASHTFDAPVGAKLSSSCPVFVMGQPSNLGQHSFPWTPEKFKHDESNNLYLPSTRSPRIRLFIYAFGVGSVDIYLNNATTPGSTHPLTNGYNLIPDIENIPIETVVLRLSATVPILAACRGRTTDNLEQDFRLLPPRSNKIIGLRNSIVGISSSATQNTTMWRSNSIDSFELPLIENMLSFNSPNTVSNNNGTSSGYLIQGDGNTLVGTTAGDVDGGEGTAWLPAHFTDTHFFIPGRAIDYLAFMSEKPAVVTIYNADGSTFHVSTLTSSNTMIYKGLRTINVANNETLGAGSYIVSNLPIMVIVDFTDTFETVLLGASK